MGHRYEGAPFVTSSYSDHECVAVARPAGRIAVADSARFSEVIEVAPAVWATFLETLTVTDRVTA
jgi:hypothetical protein